MNYSKLFVAVLGIITSICTVAICLPLLVEGLSNFYLMFNEGAPVFSFLVMIVGGILGTTTGIVGCVWFFELADSTLSK